MAGESDSSADTCANCRFVSIHKRPRIEEATGFDDQLQFSDDDENVFTCLAGGGKLEIGPIALPRAACASWTAASKISEEKRAELDAIMNRFESRQKKD